MVEYLYFVKFENENTRTNPFDWEEDVFETFAEAKEFASSMISNHPEIHQTEIVRNDFGECVDSKNIGLIWSWQDEMSDISDNEEATVFSRGDFDKYSDGYNPENDSEFDDADITFETDCITDKPNLSYFGEDFKVGDEVFCKVNKKSGTVKNIKGDTITVEFAGDEDPDRIDTYYKTELLPPLKAIVEAMEENEDEVECSWCEELYDKSDCRNEVGLGWLCPTCQAAIKSRGESLTFKEEATPVKEAFNPRARIDLDYDELTITIQGNQRDVDDWDEVEHTDSYTYSITKGEAAATIWENWLTEEDVADVKGGFDTLEDNAAWEEFLETHFYDLFEKYYDQLLEYYKEYAIEEFESKYSWYDYQSDLRDRWTYEECHVRKSVLEELEEPEDYRQRLITCPECGTDSFDSETGICINCGFN